MPAVTEAALRRRPRTLPHTRPDHKAFRPVGIEFTNHNNGKLDVIVQHANPGQQLQWSDVTAFNPARASVLTSAQRLELRNAGWLFAEDGYIRHPRPWYGVPVLEDQS